jgi:ribokinase
MNNVFVVGSLNIDLIFNTQRIPEVGETMQSDSFSMLSGGKGANQAVACSQLIGSSYMIGNIGDDLFGKMLINDLEQKMVNTKYINVSKVNNSGVACILLNNGDNRIILDQGANANTSFEQVEKVLIYVSKKKDVLLTQLEVPVETVIKSLALAKNNGLITVFNPAPAKSLSDDIYKYVDVITPNEIEAEMITGFNSDSEYFNKNVVNYFLDKGVKEVVITKGCKGSVYGDGKDLILVKPFDVKVMDTTGAGDAFVGALASRIACGFSVKESLTFASASSALAVTKFGAQASMPSLREVEDFLNRKLV